MSSGVEFEEDSFSYTNKPRLPNTAAGGVPASMGSQRSNSRMAQWLIKKGWVKSEGTAQVILIAVVILNMVITFVVVKYFLL